MKRAMAVLQIALALGSMASIADAQQGAPVTIVESRPYLSPVTNGPFVVTPPDPPANATWEQGRQIDSGQWTDLNLTAGQSGRHLYLGVDANAAQIRRAEVVFDNGDSYQIDCGDQTVSPGWYSVIDIAEGRKVDHIRVVAKAVTQTTNILLRLTT